jgi:hypothetical protein
MHSQGRGGATGPVAVRLANGWKGGTTIQAVPTYRRDAHTNLADKTKLKTGGGSIVP